MARSGRCPRVGRTSCSGHAGDRVADWVASRQQGRSESARLHEDIRSLSSPFKNNRKRHRRGDREAFLESVKQNKETLAYASAELHADREILVESVKRNWETLTYATVELRGEREARLETVK